MTVQSILAVYNLASVSDKQQGQSWYARALTFAVRLSDVYDIETSTIVAVIASLSPRNRWERNMQDAESMIKVFAAGGTYADLMQLKVCTFTTGKAKAAKILSENISDRDELLATLKGPKLCEFFNCILGDSDDVCIDGHAYSIWVGDRITLANVPSIGVKLRRNIKEDYQQAARIIGVKPHVVQAITWVCWKRLHGV
jgi:membrane-bound lytic murein transglycosylase B